MPFTLSDHDRVLLEQKRRFEKKRERFVQISIPLALHNGHSPSQVADILGIDVSTVHRYRARFQEADDVADYLRVRRLGSKPRLNDEQLAELRAELTENFYRSASQIDRFIRQRFDVRLSLRQIRRVLVEQLNFRFKKTRLIPAKADLDEQRRFLTDVLEPLIESSRQAGEPLYILRCSSSGLPHTPLFRLDPPRQEPLRQVGTRTTPRQLECGSQPPQPVRCGCA